MLAAFTFIVLLQMDDSQSPERYIPDTNITLAVERMLQRQQAVAHHRIDVSTSDGIVKLEGSVPDLWSKQLAENFSTDMLGVRSVVNLLEVVPGIQRSDKELQHDVLRTLQTDPVAGKLDVSAAVERGVVRFTGHVASWSLVQLVEEVLLHVPAVTAIRNEINVRHKQQLSDDELQRNVHRAITSHAALDAGLVNLLVRDGNVLLSGAVGSAGELRRAIDMAHVEGVRHVDAAGLHVRWYARDNMRQQSPAALSEQELADSLKARLDEHPRLIQAPVRVLFKNDSATLLGHVDNLLAKRAAGDIAHHHRGVLRVHNHIKVRPSKPVTDKTIESNVSMLIASHPRLSGQAIGVRATHGVVYLTGDVFHEFQKNIAEELAARIPGTIAIENLIAYNPLPLKSDWELLEDIQSAFFWSSTIDPAHIQITVIDGVAILRGQVHSWFERQSAQHGATQAGSLRVRNQLELSSWAAATPPQAKE